MPAQYQLDDDHYRATAVHFLRLGQQYLHKGSSKNAISTYEQAAHAFNHIKEKNKSDSEIMQFISKQLQALHDQEKLKEQNQVREKERATFSSNVQMLTSSLATLSIFPQPPTSQPFQGIPLQQQEKNEVKANFLPWEKWM